MQSQAKAVGKAKVALAESDTAVAEFARQAAESAEARKKAEGVAAAAQASCEALKHRLGALQLRVEDLQEAPSASDELQKLHEAVKELQGEKASALCRIHHLAT